MLYKIVHDKDIFELNPGLRAVEAYSKLTDKQMKFVLLLCDPSKDSPIKTLTGRERRERAAILSGYKYEPDGKRLDRNARAVVDGKVESIELAVNEFKKNHYNQTQHNREALKKQIAEIREFLESDKRVPLLEKGKVVLDKSGKEIYTTDQKALKLAVELGVKLPELEEALSKLQEPEDLKFEGEQITVDDIPEEDINYNISTLEKYIKAQQSKK